MIQNGTLSCDGRPVLRNVPAGLSVVEDATGAGGFLKWTAPSSSSYLESPLGTIAGLLRFTSARRDEPYWMLPAAGKTCADVQLETQWLLAETNTGDYVMFVPIIDGPFVFTLSGDAAGLRLTGQTGDAFTPGTGGVALFVSVGRDPYALSEAGARAVMARLGTGKLRKDKPVPDFVDSFGWCTWDSFYTEVSADKVRTGLESFAAGKVEPRFLILDDGWQDYKPTPTGETRLISLNPNQARFAGDLTPTVRLAKEQFKVRTFLVWHAMIGYWGGVDATALPGYGVRDIVRSFGPGILHHQPIANVKYWGPLVGVVSPDQIGKFYNDYHQKLKSQGVDGVKVDSQSVLEGVATGQGGRVAMAKAYRQALEQSVAANFNGRLINCMGNCEETYYMSPRSTLMRTSIDFWPQRPETHGQHLYTNSQVGVWFGQFMQPDWDMFQSAHAMGPFHAAGRAVSGGPVYVSDTPDAHNFDVLRKLVCSDGTILRADNVGRPTLDCLFVDVTRDPVLLKIFNYNRDCAVMGIFNANYHADASARKDISSAVSPADVPELAGEEFAGFSHQANRLWRCKKADRAPISLAEAAWEIVSFAPVDRGLAVLGLADKLNSTGAVMQKSWTADGACVVNLRDGGQFLAWSEKAPRAVESAGKGIAFTHDPATGRLSATLPATGLQTLTLRW